MNYLEKLNKMKAKHEKDFAKEYAKAKAEGSKSKVAELREILRKEMHKVIGSFVEMKSQATSTAEINQITAYYHFASSPVKVSDISDEDLKAAA